MGAFECNIMEDLNTLHEVLANIKESAETIINLNAVVLNKIILEGNDIYNRFRDDIENDDISDDEIDEYFSRAMSDHIADAKRVKHEIDGFIRSMLKHEKHDVDSFMYQVWSGDMYDCEEIDALIELNNDLTKQEKTLDVATIYDAAVKLSKKDT